MYSYLYYVFFADFMFIGVGLNNHQRSACLVIQHYIPGFYRSPLHYLTAHDGFAVPKYDLLADFRRVVPVTGYSR